jgi:hypothetical protein
MKAQHAARPRCFQSTIWPGETLVPEEVVQNGGFYGNRGCHEVLQTGEGERFQRSQLNDDPHQANGRESCQTNQARQIVRNEAA